jgi:hypothetical protein
LTNIAIDLDDYTVGEDHMLTYHRDKMNTLISSIHNAPALTEVTFGQTAIRIEDLDIGCVHKNQAIGPLATAISKLTQLESYLVNYCPSEKPILDAMDANIIHLKHLKFSIRRGDPIEETFEAIQAATSTLTISSLEPDCDHTIPALAVSRGIIRLSDIEYWTHLRIDYGYFYNVAILIVDIMQNLVKLESLTFYFLQVGDQKPWKMTTKKSAMMRFTTSLLSLNQVESNN